MKNLQKNEYLVIFLNFLGGRGGFGEINHLYFEINQNNKIHIQCVKWLKAVLMQTIVLRHAYSKITFNVLEFRISSYVIEIMYRNKNRKKCFRIQ